MTDETFLLQALKNHEPRAQDKFYEAHFWAMKGICFKILKQEEDSEDAAQIGFTQFFKNIHRVEDRGDGSAVLFLKGVMRQKSAAVKRLKQRHAGHETVKAALPEVARIPEILYSVDDDIKQACINRLSEKQRTIFTMHEQGYTDAEIASHLNVKESIVSSELFRAKKQVLVAYRAVGLCSTPGYDMMRYGPNAAIELSILRDQRYYIEDNPAPGKPVATCMCKESWCIHKCNFIEPPPGKKRKGPLVPPNYVRLDPPEPERRYGT